MESICSDCGRTFDSGTTPLNISHGKLIFSPEQSLPAEQLCPDCRLRDPQIIESYRKLRLRFAIFTVAAIVVLASIAIPNLWASRRAANEAAVISTLRTIGAAQSTYSSTDGNGNYATLEELISSHLITDSLASGKKNGYIITVTKLNDVSDDASTAFDITAVPESISGWNRTGSRSFYTNEDGIIYYNNTATAPTRTPNGSDGTPLGE